MYANKTTPFNFNRIYYYALSAASVQDRIEKLDRTAKCKDFAGRLKARSQSEWDVAGWYLSVLNQVLKDGENCEYLKLRETTQRKIAAIDQLEREIEFFLR